MTELVFFLEEASAAAMLEGLLPRLIPADVVPRYVTFEGKQDLEAQLVKRLRGYRNPNALFVVMRDQDAHPNCKVIKRNLAKLCQQPTRRVVLIRIACRELDLNQANAARSLGRRVQKNSKTPYDSRVKTRTGASPCCESWRVFE